MRTDLETRLGAWMQATPVSAEALAALRESRLPARRRVESWPQLLRIGAVGAVVLLIGALALSWPGLQPPPAATSPAPSPTPSAVSIESPRTSAPRRCHVSDFEGTGESVGSALGNAGAIVRLQNVSGSACIVAGYPAVQLVGSSGQPMTTDTTRATDGDYLFPAMPVNDVLLAPSDIAAFQLGYPDNPSGDDASLPYDVACPVATGLEVVLPGSTEALVVALRLAPCEGNLNVSPIHSGPEWIGFSEASPAPSASTQVSLASMAWFDRDHGLFVGSTGAKGDVATVWQTSDRGRSWQSIALAGGGMSAVTISGTTAWAGSACSMPAPCRNGLYRSDDGGVTWSRIAYQPVASMAFADRNHGWALPQPEINQSEPSILASVDGGVTWIPRPSPCPPGTGVPVALSFPAPNRGWLACNGTLGAGSATKAILRTTDGEHWDVMASAPWPDGDQPVGRIESTGYLTGLSMVANGAGMYWADRGVSERTLDGGATWTGMTATSFDVVIPAAGWAIDENDWLMYVWNGDAGAYLLQESTDGGKTWGAAAGFVPPSS